MTRQERIDAEFMRLALQRAEAASAANEVPVGAVLVHEGKVIGSGFNQSISACDPSAHAEVIALRDAASAIKNHRLLNTTLYVTLEPCLMCCGCMQHARIDRLVFGAREPRTGAVVSINEVLADPAATRRIAVTEGVLGHECAQLLEQFFGKRRG